MKQLNLLRWLLLSLLCVSCQDQPEKQWTAMRSGSTVEMAIEQTYRRSGVLPTCLEEVKRFMKPHSAAHAPRQGDTYSWKWLGEESRDLWHPSAKLAMSVYDGERKVSTTWSSSIDLYRNREPWLVLLRDAAIADTDIGRAAKLAKVVSAYLFSYRGNWPTKEEPEKYVRTVDGTSPQFWDGLAAEPVDAQDRKWIGIRSEKFESRYLFPRSKPETDVLPLEIDLKLISKLGKVSMWTEDE